MIEFSVYIKHIQNRLYFWKAKDFMFQVLVKLKVDQVTSCHFRIRFRSGKPNSDWNELSSLMTRCIWWNLQVYAIGLSDHSDWMSIHKLPNKKAYTEIVGYSATDTLLSKTMNKVITLAMLAFMIYSANT